MNARRLLLLLFGVSAPAVLVFGLAGSAQGRPGIGTGAHAAYVRGYLGPGGGIPTDTPTPACPQVWTPVTSQNASNIRNELWGVGAVSDTDAWAVGIYQSQSGYHFPLVERWNGTQWNMVSSAPITSTGELHAMTVLAPNDIWAVGTRNETDSLVEHWDGTAWTIVPSPNPGQGFNNPAAISAAGPNDIWAVGVKGPYNPGTAFVMHWNGTAWTNVTIPTMPGVYSEFYGVTALASNNVWAAGYYNTSDGHKLTLIVHWDGTSWNIVPSPNYGTNNANSLLSVAGVAANDIWAVGELDFGASALIEHWDGSVWSIATTISDGSLRSVLPISANNVWAVGTRGELQTLAMHWDGTSWNIVPSANPDPNGNAFKWIALTQSGGLWGVGYRGGLDQSIHQTLIELYNSPTPPCPPTVTPTYTSTPTLTSTPTNTSMITVTGTPPTDTPTPDCSSVDVHPTDIWPPGAFIYVTVPPGWTWTWDPITDLMRYNCGPDYPYGVGCYWSCSPDEPRVGYAIIHIFDQNGVERCSVGIEGNQPACPPPTDTPTSTLTGTPTECPGGSCTPTGTATGTPTITPTPSNTNTPSTVGTTATVVATSTATISASSTPEVGGTSTASATTIPTSTATACPIQFTDVPPGSTFYTFIRCMACAGIISGYSLGCQSGNPCFRPNNQVTRGQLSKIVSLAAGFLEDHTAQTFADVPVGSTFYQYVERMASRGIIGGYPCGGSGEPCDDRHRPYFRPNANATRGQIAKIDVLAAVQSLGWALLNPSTNTFEDVAPGTTFYRYVETAYAHNVIGGYACGTPPAGRCVPPSNRPYFLPSNNATRGQTSKIVANTFFPGCQTSDR